MSFTVELRKIEGAYNAGKLGEQTVTQRVQSVMVGSTAIKDAHGCSPIECGIYDPKYNEICFLALASRWPRKTIDEIRAKVQALVDDDTKSPIQARVPAVAAPKFTPPADYDEA